ncbi:hypothetical protein KR222_008880 [Zaprionus bogoriensis]|nr:hypothetical protein KR222_008880 [Zaprionus bogoriensis]
MATLRSESHSVPNTTCSDRLTALKDKLTTCFQHWRQQLLLHHSHSRYRSRSHFQFHSQKKPRAGSGGAFYDIFVRANCSVFGEKVTYLRKFRKVFAARKAAAQSQAEPGAEPVFGKRICQVTGQQEQEQLQIVATLFSSTLISQHSSSSHSNLSSDMTIMEDTYLGVRDEYPDIDAEIRAILLAHAQNGITISSIKNEYRQLTGTAFPLHENVTDFLLTIPFVTAECCESGKRLFSVKPTEENRHLHEMIMQQRQRDAPNNNHKNSTSNINNHNNIVSYSKHSNCSQAPPRLWRSQYKRRYPQKVNNNFNYSEKPPVVKTGPVQPLATVALASYGGVYQDNWKHLNNQYQLSQVSASNNNHNNNNIVYSNSADPAQLGIAPPTDHLQQQQQPLKQQHHQLQHVQLQHLEIGEYTHKRRQEFTPTPTTLSCPSQHDSMFTINSDYDAYLLDFPLLGDDFFLYLARMELKCRFKKYERVLQSGLCISGQTINAARLRLQHVDLAEMTQIIVNIGSVDIMRGRPLVQIEHDFRQLIKEMHNRRFVPVLTTLAPLANYRHDKETCDKVLRFNKFIRSEGRHLTVIDIHSCLINENGVVRFDCFQNGPRSVTGSSEPHVFWNKIGRQRVLQMIEQNLEYN